GRTNHHHEHTMNLRAGAFMRSSFVPLVFAAALSAPRSADVPLATLDLTKMRVQAAGGRGGATAQSVAQANKSIDGNPLRIGGKEFAAGVGTRATSVLFVNLAGGADRFTAMVGADDNPVPPPPAGSPPPAAAPPPTPIVFRVVGDGRVLHVSKPVVRGDPAEAVNVDVRGIKTLVLQVKPVNGNRP